MLVFGAAAGISAFVFNPPVQNSPTARQRAPPDSGRKFLYHFIHSEHSVQIIGLKRKGRIVAALAVALLLSSIFLLTEPRERKLKDGSVLRVTDVCFGKLEEGPRFTKMEMANMLGAATLIFKKAAAILRREKRRDQGRSRPNQ